MSDNALKCKYNGGTRPIGYLIDDEQYFQIDPLTALFVLDAFKRYNVGATMTQIRDWLNDQQLRESNTSIQNLLNAL